MLSPAPVYALASFSLLSPSICPPLLGLVVSVTTAGGTVTTKVPPPPAPDDFQMK